MRIASEAVAVAFPMAVAPAGFAGREYMWGERPRACPALRSAPEAVTVFRTFKSGARGPTLCEVQLLKLMMLETVLRGGLNDEYRAFLGWWAGVLYFRSHPRPLFAVAVNSRKGAMDLCTSR